MSAPLLTVAEVAEFVSLSEHTVRQAIRAGELTATKLRRCIRVAPDDLAAWLDAGRVRAASGLPQSDRPPVPRPQVPTVSARQAIRDSRRAA